MTVIQIISVEKERKLYEKGWSTCRKFGCKIMVSHGLIASLKYSPISCLILLLFSGDSYQPQDICCYLRDKGEVIMEKKELWCPIAFTQSMRLSVSGLMEKRQNKCPYSIILWERRNTFFHLYRFHCMLLMCTDKDIQYMIPELCSIFTSVPISLLPKWIFTTWLHMWETPLISTRWSLACVTARQRSWKENVPVESLICSTFPNRIQD